MTRFTDAVEGVVAAGLRSLPDWRGKTNIALGWKRLRERRGPLDGSWELRLYEGSVMCLPRGSQMTWSVAATGCWDRHVIELVAPYIAPGTVALDVGASLGLWTLPLAGIARSVGARLSCFEPNPENLRWLQANIERNDLCSVIDVHAVALGAHATTARLGYRERGGGNAALVEIDAADAVDVPVVRMDDISFLRRVSFMKLDVEGFELEVLRGGRALIERDRPAIFGEFNASWLRMRQTQLDAGLSWITALGYDVLQVEERRSAHWRSRDLAQLRPLQSPLSQGSENLLLLPHADRRPGAAPITRRAG